MSKIGATTVASPGDGRRRRDQVIDVLLIVFFLLKLKCWKAAHIRKIQERVNISPCSYYRTLRLGVATGEMYLLMLYALQEIQEERYDRLFTREEFPVIRSLSECPECLRKEFDEFLGNSRG